MAHNTESHCQQLSKEVRELSSFRHVDEEHGSEISPLVFMREYVSQNRPFVLRGGAKHWPALKRWTLPYLSQKLGDKKFTVDVTPDGRGDSVVDVPEGRFFVTPEERQMTFDEFTSLLERSREDPALGVPYAQHQNSNFLSEFSELAADAEQDIAWASEALNQKPDAVNMWIGDNRASTSLHKDHYENLYVVVAGVKHFTLLPPADYHRMYMQKYRTAKYHQDKDTMQFQVVKSRPATFIPWTPVNPFPDPDRAEVACVLYPRFFDGPSPLEVTVNPGDIFYLPALWYHHVQQTPNENGVAIAVNFWYVFVFVL